MFSNVKIAQNFNEALMVQVRVVYALMLRETKTMYGRSKFGYLWVIVQTAFGVGFFWGIREFMGAKDISGIPMPVFLITGFSAWNAFMDSAMKVAASVTANKALLYYSKVRHFDLAISRVLLSGATNVVVLILLLFGAYSYGYKFPVANLWPFIISWVFILLLGLGLGTLCCALSRFSDSIMVIIMMLLRIGLFVSGVVVPQTTIPYQYRFLVDYNPLFQLIEFSRSSFSYGYHIDFVDFGFIGLCTIVLVFVGLFLEKATRYKEDVV